MIPKKIHFIYGLTEDFGGIPFQFCQWVAVKSAMRLNPDYEIHFWYEFEPATRHFDELKDQMILHRVIAPREIYGNPIPHFAHRADVMRLQILYEYGGIYLDMDTITVKSYDVFLEHKVVMFVGKRDGREYGLCNAVMMGEPGHQFFYEWLRAFKDFRSKGYDEYYDELACVYPYHLAKQTGDEIGVGNATLFFEPDMTPAGLANLFYEPDYENPSAFGYHLWEKNSQEILKKLDETNYQQLGGVYSRAIKSILFPDQQSPNKKAVCFFSSSERLHQTWLSIKSFHDYHGHEEIDYWLLLCCPSEEAAKIKMPAFINTVTCDQCHLFYSTQIERFGHVDGFSRTLIIDYVLGKGYSKLICLDGDMEVFANLEYIYDALDEYDIVVTPHILKPLPRDGKLLRLEDICFSGSYNSAFFACSNRAPAREFVEWWLKESLIHKEIDFSLCRFSEQGWLRFVADFVDKVWINREPGLNYAYWRYDGKNFGHDGETWTVENQKLKLFHYTGLQFDDLSRISKWQNRYQADPQLLRFLTDYKNRSDEARERAVFEI